MGFQEWFNRLKKTLRPEKSGKKIFEC